MNYIEGKIINSCGCFQRKLNGRFSKFHCILKNKHLASDLYFENICDLIESNKYKLIDYNIDNNEGRPLTPILELKTKLEILLNLLVNKLKIFLAIFNRVYNNKFLKELRIKIDTWRYLNKYHR